MTFDYPLYNPPQPVAQVAKGCVCPPTAERTCLRSDCGRKDPNYTAYGIRLTTAAASGYVLYNEAEENAHQRDYGDETGHNND